MNINFDEWIQDCAPEFDIDEVNKETHLAVLNERLRHRKIQQKNRERWQLRGSMVAALVMFMLIGGNFSPLGSDGFDQTVLDIPANDQGNMVMFGGMSRMGMRVPVDQSEEETTRQVTRFAARLGEPVRVHGYIMGGKELWWIERTLNDGDYSRTYTASTQEPQNIDEKDISLFIVAEWMSVLEDMESGKIQAVGKKKVLADGILFETEIFEILSTEYGEITYITGTPVS